MSNEDFLKFYQTKYESLKYFSILNNRLVLNYKETSMIPLFYFKLANLNENLCERIFSLDPIQIFHIIYMFELLYKFDDLSPYEEQYIEAYVKSYNELEKNILGNIDNTNNDDIKIKHEIYNSLRLPIDFAYNSYFINSPCSQKIQTIINNNTESVENGKGKQLKLVPKTGFIPQEQDFTLDDISYLGKAGFTTLLLISGSVIATCLYIVYFIFSN